MQYRTLGKTGLRVSAIGLGCVQLGSSDTGYAVHVVRRALELGVNYIDAARGYRDAETKVGRALEGQRDKVILSTKTGAGTRDAARREIHESLRRLRTGYLDNCHLHCLGPGRDIEQRLGPGGALEALIEARQQGLIRHIGCTSHHIDTLIEAINRFDFEVILVIMNVVERRPLDRLIPLCQSRGVGVTVMKPLATGLLPAPLALKWLLNQPIACAVPGATTVEEVEENAMVGHRDPALSAEERTRVHDLQQELEHVRCRMCEACLPCPVQIPISEILGSDDVYDHYRTMGPEAFRAFRWSRRAIRQDLPQRERRIAAIERCSRCGECEAKCPYGLPIIEMLQSMVPAMKDMLRIYGDLAAMR